MGQYPLTITGLLTDDQSSEETTPITISIIAITTVAQADIIYVIGEPQQTTAITPFTVDAGTFDDSLLSFTYTTAVNVGDPSLVDVPAGTDNFVVSLITDETKSNTHTYTLTGTLSGTTVGGDLVTSAFNTIDYTLYVVKIPCTLFD